MAVKQVQIRRMEVPDEWSPESVDFINKLLQRKARNRLGFNGIAELKRHAWLRDTNWQLFTCKAIEPPLAPQRGDNFISTYVAQFKDGINTKGVVDQEVFESWNFKNLCNGAKKSWSEDNGNVSMFS